MQVKFLRWVLSGVLAGMASLCLAAPPPPSPQVALVNRLYKDFSYQIIVDEPNFEGFGSGTPRPVLLKYLTPELTQLLVDDLKCQRREQSICNLESQILWTGNDITWWFVRIHATDAADKVEVELHSADDPRDDNVVKLLYRLKKTSRGWRIHDIEYPGEYNWTLARTLKQK